MSKTIKIQIEIAAVPMRVFEALWDSRQLEAWFAEYAFVSHEEWQYDFWGIYTPETPSPVEGAHPLVEFKKNDELRYAWRLRDTDTLVKYRVERSARGTLLTLIHEYVPLPRKREYSLTDYWAYLLENLRNYVERDDVSPRLDFSDVPYGKVQLEVRIQASREEVFQALTDPEQLDRYISRRAIVEPESGGVYDFGWGKGGPGRVLDFQHNERLSHTWDYRNEPATQVTWTLEDHSEYTLLRLVHDGFDPTRPCDDYRIAWAGYLAWIKSLIETGERWIRPEITASDYVFQPEPF